MGCPPAASWRDSPAERIRSRSVGRLSPTPTNLSTASWSS